MNTRGANSPGTSRFRVVAWALWDCGATGVNAVVVTFVFSVYLTEQVGSGMPGPTTPASWLGRALTIAGLFVALLAPATGIWVDPANRRRTALAILTGLVVAMTSAMSLIRADYHYLWPGLVLLACTAACSDLATVPYNAMLRTLSTEKTSGRISGLGSAAGYAGSVLLLLIVYFGFIPGRRRHPRPAGHRGGRRPERAGGDGVGGGVVGAVRAGRCWCRMRLPASARTQSGRRVPRCLPRAVG